MWYKAILRAAPFKKCVCGGGGGGTGFLKGGGAEF